MPNIKEKVKYCKICFNISDEYEARLLAPHTGQNSQLFAQYRRGSEIL